MTKVYAIYVTADDTCLGVEYLFKTKKLALAHLDRQKISCIRNGGWLEGVEKDGFDWNWFDEKRVHRHKYLIIELSVRSKLPKLYGVTA